MLNDESICLHDAVRCGDIATIKEILQRDPSCVNDYDLNLKTPLHLVYEHVNAKDPVQADDRLPIMQLLIDYGADVNIRRGCYFNSPLLLVVEKQQIEGVKLLLQNKADPNLLDFNYQTALNLAIKLDSKRITRLLLDHKADLTFVDRNDRTPLDKAINCSKFKLVKILVAAGAKSVNIYESLRIALLKVINSKISHEQQEQHQQQQLIQFLLSHASEVDSHGNFSLKALVYYFRFVSIRLGNGQCINELLKNQGNYAEDYSTGDSDLHLAVRQSDTNKVQLLLEKGANVNVKNVFGETPLHLAMRLQVLGCEEICNLLIKSGADLHAQNFIDETPLRLATINSRSSIVWESILTKIGGKCEVTREFFMKSRINLCHTPYDKNELNLDELLVSVAFGNEDLVDRLLDQYYIEFASKQYCCRVVNIALEIAINNRFPQIVKMLLEEGFRANRYIVLNLYLYESLSTKGNPMSCLFWEFNDNVIINELFITAFCKGIKSSGTEEFTYLQTFYYAINLRLNKLHPDLIPVKGLFKLSKQLSNTLDVCNTKLDELKEVKVGDLSLFDIITMRLNSLVKLLSSDDQLDACKKFCSSLENNNEMNYYERAIKVRIDLAIEKKQTMFSAKDCLNEVLQSVLTPMNLVSLPDNVVWKIFDYLNVRDLKQIVKSNEHSVYLFMKFGRLCS